MHWAVVLRHAGGGSMRCAGCLIVASLLECLAVNVCSRKAASCVLHNFRLGELVENKHATCIANRVAELETASAAAVASDSISLS